MRQDKIEAIKTARALLAQRPVYLDTETTGLGNTDQIIDIAVVDSDGTILLDTLVRPTAPIPGEATSIHGITNEDIVDAPLYPEIRPSLFLCIEHRFVVIYNAAYDTRLMRQSMRAHGITVGSKIHAVCAMELYAQFYGDWNGRSYLWQSQANAAAQLGIAIPDDLHRAAADANLCRLIVQAMANTPLPGEAAQSSQLAEIDFRWFILEEF